MMAESGPDLVTVLVGGAVAVIGSLASYMGGVRNGKAAFITAVEQAAKHVMEMQGAALTSIEARCARAEAKCEELAEEHQGCQRDLRLLREEFERLLAAEAPVPAYKMNAPRGGAPADE